MKPHCEAVLGHVLLADPNGHPYTGDRVCRQVVGLTPICDKEGTPHYVCSIEGHRERVQAGIDRADAAIRAYRDMLPPSNDPLELVAVRPEMRGVFR